MEERQGQEEDFVPAPPKPEMTIRTMESDVKSIEQGGGEIGAPKVFTPRQAPRPEQEEVRAGLNIPGYTGPEKSIFQSQASINVRQEQKPIGKSDSKWKATAVVIGILIGIVALVLIGYYIVFPWLFPSQMPSV